MKAYKILIGQFIVKCSLGKPRRRCDDNNMGLKKISYEDKIVWN
jgi:hypothetical protein